jgi:glycerophosphoryl diester phosphodiesterase
MKTKNKLYIVSACLIVFVSCFFIPKIDRLAWRATSIAEFRILKSLGSVISTPNERADLKNFIVASHRGVFSKEICDNTEKSILLALKNGYSFIELDVSFSKDYIPIIFHDYNFKRKANLDKKISEVYWEEIQKLELFDGQKISSLESILKNYAGHFEGIILDLKTEDVDILNKVKNFNETINRYKNSTTLYIIGLPFNLIKKIKMLNPNLKVGCENLGVIYNYISGHDLISLNYYSQFSNLEYYVAKKLGLDTIIWTINEPELIIKLKKYSPIIVLTDLRSISSSI